MHRAEPASHVPALFMLKAHTMPPGVINCDNTDEFHL